MSGSNDPKTAAEQAVAKLLQDMDALQKSQSETQEIVKTLSERDEALKDVDFKNIIDRLEKTDANMKRIQERIRTNRSSPLYIPGLEDETEKFSLLRGIMVIRSPKLRNDKRFGFEWEVIKQHMERVKATQTISIDSDGGYFVPDQVIADVIQAIYTRTNLISLDGDGNTLVSVIDGLTGSPVKIPKFDGGSIAYWIGEEDDYILSKASTGDVSMQPRKLGVLIELTEEMRRFQGYGLDALLRRDMVKALSKKLDWTLLYGQGTDNAPRGVMSMQGINEYSAELGGAYSLAALADASGAELTFDGLDEMMGLLDDQDVEVDESFRWALPNRYVRRLKQSKVDNYSAQAVNNPYLLGRPMLTDASLASVIGPFVKSTQIRTTNVPGESRNWATTTSDEEFGDVVGANWNEVLLGRWGTGIEIEEGQSDDDFVKDKGKIKGRLYADIGHRQPLGIVVCPDARVRG